jgi:monoamine oxidase
LSTLYSDRTPTRNKFHSYVAYDWGKAEHVYGGYSSPTAGVTMEDRDHLASTHAGAIFFAGEHTARSYMAMHGAMDTGERAATRVAEYLAVKANI